MAGRGCNERTEERTGRRHSACDATNDEIIRDCQLARPRKRVEEGVRSEGEETSRGLFLTRRKLPTRNTIREITIVKEGEGKGRRKRHAKRAERAAPYLIHISAFHDDGKKAKKVGLPLSPSLRLADRLMAKFPTKSNAIRRRRRRWKCCQRFPAAVAKRHPEHRMLRRRTS